MSHSITITALVVLLASVSVPAAADDDVYVYTNADIEKLEPLPTGRAPMHAVFDAEAWEFVEAFVARERDKIVSDRDHELERERVEIEADRPVGHGERYPYYLRVPHHHRVHPLPRIVEDGRSDSRTPSPTSVPHPMFRARPPVREFTPGLGNSYRGPSRP